MIDSNDRERIDEARQELHRIILDREMKDAYLLVFANKKDLPGVMPPEEVIERLKLEELKGRIWYVMASCATTGDGLFEGLVRVEGSIDLWFPAVSIMLLFADIRCRDGSPIWSSHERVKKSDSLGFSYRRKK